MKDPVLGMKFIRIPKGSFQMGSHKYNDTINAELLHKVIISKDYWLSQTEVTQNQWQKIMGNEEIHPEKPSPFRNTNPNYPIVSISYFDIEIFLNKLNVLSNEYHFRLPTEAEWEYACRAGTKTPFSYGLYLTDTLANYNAEIASKYSVSGAYHGSPKPVRSYPPNQWGLYDMHGNVWEWVSDWYGPYPKEEITDPKGASYGKEKVLRGGSWYFGAENAKSSHRKTHEPGLWGFSIGFRIVCEKI
ncbi:formylglycine-generating enzyme family protein [Leptobacterium sp. I13]|uniref:formylglycine-generating enzyme family protein n=1 Tax=Leptobacterium meishanense TaxID=3128904 RepID=UPI0030EE660D